ncbi:MAG TPA: ABC transporter ATP-binding protein [Blastocatellia bacterium]|nr:ABC transporter ATP-binding protein [Blastocatellia bacterium]
MAAKLTARVEKRSPSGFTLSAAFETDPTAQVTVLFGPSGSGKTTVLRCLAGLDHPDRGAIAFGDDTWFDSERAIAKPPQKRRIGYMFQEHALFPHLAVRANIAYGLAGLSRAERDSRVADLAAIFGIGDLLERQPLTLSGGERQRAALARSLAPRPHVLLLDEPLASLDVPAREHLRAELRSLLRQFDVAVVLVTHDRDEALAIGDRMVLIAQGQVQQAGPIQEVFSRPANVAVAAIVGVETVAAGTIRDVADGIATVKTGSAELAAVWNAGASNDVLVCIRAEDVTVERGVQPESSARNRLHGRVVDTAAIGPLVRVTIDCGFELTALVTKRSCEELELTRGAEVTAVVKAQAVHVIPRT